jgi:hypothetical protein
LIIELGNAGTAGKISKEGHSDLLVNLMKVKILLQDQLKFQTETSWGCIFEIGVLVNEQVLLKFVETKKSRFARSGFEIGENFTLD